MLKLRNVSPLLLLLPHYASSILSGWVESPGYPRGYAPLASLNWSRCAPKGYTISLNLIHLDLEDSPGCEHDALEISADGHQMTVLCGRKRFRDLESHVNPTLVSLAGGCLALAFRSDYSNTQRHTGFRGFYTLQDYNECDEDPDHGCSQFCHNYIGGYRCACRPGYHLDRNRQTCTVACSEDRSGSMKGTISSPMWPGPYAENAQCTYTLSVEEHLQLVLQFPTAFDVEQGPDGQCLDYLMVELPSESRGPFCGQVAPASPIVTGSHRVRILFTTDGHGFNRGFTLNYEAKAKTCPGFIDSHSTVAPQKAEHQHGHAVTVTCELGYVLDTDDDKTISRSEYVTTCQRTGSWRPMYSCKPVDCGYPEIPKRDILQMMDPNAGTQFEDKIHFNCSSIYYTLEGENTYICNASGDWVSVNGNQELPRCTEECGKTAKDFLSPGRILGGSPARLGEIPWQLFIREPSRGGATLINDRWAVTAAHVVERKTTSFQKVYGGIVDSTKSLQGGADMNIDRIIIHPSYIVCDDHRSCANFNHDIALIRLASRVQLGPNLLPICLPVVGGGLRVDQLGTISGWGKNDRNVELDNKKTQFLHHTAVKGLSVDECNDTPDDMIFTENMFCAGDEGKDSCREDSGGPFVLPRLHVGSQGNSGPYRLIGIVSWGPPCSERMYKGYYTKVENYINWIKNTIDTVEREERGKGGD